MRNLDGGIPLEPFYEKPAFLSNKDVVIMAGAALVSGVALSVMAAHITPFAVTVAGTCMAAVAGVCLMSKAVAYYSKITQDLQEKSLTLHLRLRQAEGDIRQLQNEFQLLENQMNRIDEIVESAEQVTLKDCKRQGLAIAVCTNEPSGEHGVGNFPERVPLMKKNILLLTYLFAEEAQHSHHIPASILGVIASLNSNPRSLDSYSNCVQIVNTLAADSLDLFKEITEEMKQLRKDYDYAITGCKVQLIRKKEEFNAQCRRMASDPDVLVQVPVNPVGAGLFSTHFIERCIVPYLPYFSRAQERADSMYRTCQQERPVLSQKIQEKNACLRQVREELQQIRGEFTIMDALHTQNEQNILRKYQLMCNVNNLLFEIASSCRQAQRLEGPMEQNVATPAQQDSRSDRLYDPSSDSDSDSDSDEASDLD